MRVDSCALSGEIVTRLTESLIKPSSHAGCNHKFWSVQSESSQSQVQRESLISRRHEFLEFICLWHMHYVESNKITWHPFCFVYMCGAGRWKDKHSCGWVAVTQSLHHETAVMKPRFLPSSWQKSGTAYRKGFHTVSLTDQTLLDSWGGFVVMGEASWFLFPLETSS